ncbi:MAG: hypothetical protein JNJ59_16095, partial [Deltaproteobacteria bacterium]|nr:hypothetical protein [Deltaproteobacteria bacterium]
TVTLAIENLYTTAHPWTGDADLAGETEWRNPCLDNPLTPALEGCSLAVDCVENADASVVFNLTVMREANQGFFDIAVNFEDIFCSAKVDCQPALLHDALGARGPTAVVAFACTSGQGNAPTTLYQDALAIDCDGTDHDHVIQPIGAGGNLGAQSPGVFQSAVYHGAEQLAGYDKCYWNTAIGMASDLGSNCHLRTRASAAQTPFAVLGGAFNSPGAHAYPYIDIDVQLTTGNVITCGAAPHPLDGTGVNAGVATKYTLVSAVAGEAFDYAMRCGQAPSAPPVACPCFTSADMDAAWAAAQAAILPNRETQGNEPFQSCKDTTISYPSGDVQTHSQLMFQEFSGVSGGQSSYWANYVSRNGSFLGLTVTGPNGVATCQAQLDGGSFDENTGYTPYPSNYSRYISSPQDAITPSQANACKDLIHTFAAAHGVACVPETL